MYKLDGIDKQILLYLMSDARMAFTEIAKKMDVSAGTIHVRYKKMEDAGIVLGTTLKLNYSKLDYDFVSYVGILLNESKNTKVVLEKLRKIPNVTVVQEVSGRFNLFCKIRARNPRDAKDVIFEIDQIPEILRTESMTAFSEEFNDNKRLITEIMG